MKHNHNKERTFTVPEDSFSKDEALLMFGKYRSFYQHIEAPKSGLESIIGHIKSSTSPESQRIRWWKIAFVVVPSALLLFIMISIQKGDTPLPFLYSPTNSSSIIKNIDEIEEIVYNMDASEIITNEEDTTIVAIVQDDPALAFNINYYDEDF